MARKPQRYHCQKTSHYFFHLNRHFCLRANDIARNRSRVIFSRACADIFRRWNRGVGSVCFSSWLWSASVSLCTFALLLLNGILRPWRGTIQKSIARVQTHFFSLDVGPAAKPEIRPNLLYSKQNENRAWSQVTAAKIIFLEFAQVSLLSSYVFGWVLSFLSVDLRGTSSVSHDQFRIWLGAKGQQGVGSLG